MPPPPQPWVWGGNNVVARVSELGPPPLTRARLALTAALSANILPANSAGKDGTGGLLYALQVHSDTAVIGDSLERQAPLGFPRDDLLGGGAPQFLQYPEKVVG